jgi:Na+/melibiose symporter-like transporter
VTALPLDLGWRAVVAVSAPLAAATVVLGTRALPRDTNHAAARSVRVDVIGLLLLAAATVAVLLPLVQSGLSAATTIGLVAVAAGAVTAFAWWERRAGLHDPDAALLPPTLRRAPAFVSGTLVSTFWFGARLAQQVVVTLFLIDVLHLSALVAAAASVPSAAAMAVTASASWRLVAWFGTRVISVALAVQMLLTTVLALTLPHLDAGAAVPLLLGVNTLSGIAGGCVDSPNRAHTLQHSPDASCSVAAGFLHLAQRLSATVCIAAATGIALTGRSAQPTAHGTGLALGLCAGLVCGSLLVSVRRAGRSK